MPPSTRRPRGNNGDEGLRKAITPGATAVAQLPGNVGQPKAPPAKYKHDNAFPQNNTKRSLNSLGADDAYPTLRSGFHDEEGPFKDLKETVLRRKMPHHPFPKEDAPYMQAYTSAVLENDWHAYNLLQKLSPGNSPSFYDYGRKPPSDVLDLGCGEGHWVMHAAKTWKNAHVTGFDLLDVHLNIGGEVSSRYDAESVPKNVTWSRGNFVKYALPFADDTFELVRMANLALCIPLDRWGFVLGEAERVLKPGGRLELIDDVLFFPPVAPPLVPSKDLPSRQYNSPDSDSSDDTVVGSPVLDDTGLPSTSATLRPLPPRLKHSRTISSTEYCTNTAITTSLETTFNNMLRERYGVHSQPYEFVEQIMAAVFGFELTAESHVFQLAVPSRQLFEQRRSRPGPDIPPERRSLDDDREAVGTLKNIRQTAMLNSLEVLTLDPEEYKEDDDNPFDKAYISPKAAQFLMGDERTRASRMSVPFQPPGLILLPSDCMEFSPAELEMHACRNINVLLGCKHALISYITERSLQDGSTVLKDAECEDIFWDYERFKRKRFNWPMDYPEILFEVNEASTRPTLFRRLSAKNTAYRPTGRQRTKSIDPITSIKTPPLNDQDMIPVREIHVFHAIKVVSDADV